MANIPVREKPASPIGLLTIAAPYDPQAAGHEQAATLSGDSFGNDGRTLLWVRNPTGAGIDVTFTIQGSCENQVAHVFAVSVPSGEQGYYGPFPHDRFSADDGLVAIEASSTSLLVAAVRF